MEDTLMATGSTISIESDLKMENSSDTNNDSDDENSDLEITFGPWPPFPSKQDTENPDDQMQVNFDSQDSSQLAEQYEEEHNFNMEADSDNVSLDRNSDIESAESYSKTDDITSQNIQVNEIELMDVIGPYELAHKNENLELNSENTIVKVNFESTEFIEDDESRIPTDTDTEEGNEIYPSDAETTDITDMNEPITNITSLPTECDDVISNCVPSDGGVSPYTNDTLNSDVINKTQPQIEPDIVIKEEPKMDGYPDSSPSEIEEDDNLFVSTEHGRMFMRTVAAEHKDNEEKEIKETETEFSTDKVQQTGSMLKSGRFNKKTTNPVPVYVVKKTKVSDQEADDHTNAELMPGRILGQDVSLETRTKEPTERDDTQLVGQIQLPRTNGGKFKKISKTLINSSQKTNEILEQEARKLTRKTISPALSSSSVSGDDTMPENQESYNLKARPADKEVVSLTNENSQLDLSLVKTEPEDYSEHNLDSKATDAGPHEADATSWIKKEPLTVDARQENTMEMNTPFPLKLIRNKGIDTFAPFSTMRKQVASTSKLPKTPASILLGGSPVTLQTGQKIWYTLPKGGHSTIQSEGNSNQTVKVIKLNNIDNTSSVVPLPGNLQLVRLQKTPTYTIPTSKGSEVPMVSVLKNKKLSLTRKASDNAEEDVQGNKNLILRKIDGIIKKNLELLNQDVQYPRSEEIDEETGNSMILIPKVKVTTQEKKVRKQTNKVIYRFDDRSKRSKKNKRGTVNSSTSVPLLSLLKITGTEAEKRPAMCDGFTQTKKDNPSTKKMVSGKAVMVKDFSIQTNISSENAETTGEDMPQETPENSSGAASTSLTEQVPANSEDTDLLMDVEDVDSLNIETRPLLDPLTVPRPSWKWTGRRTSSIGTNTGESSLDDDNSMNPLDHQYSVVPSKEKQRRQQNRVLAKERVRHKAEWLKLQKVKKSIRRQTYLKNKEWEYDCKLAMLKQKSEDRKKSSVDNLEIGKKALSIEKPDLLADVAVGQKKQEENKAQMNDGPVEKVVDRRGEGNVEAADADSSGNANLTAAEPATRSSSRIKTRQSHALENSDMTRYFQRCKMKLGEVEDIGDVESTPYITDSSDEDWQEMVSGLSPFDIPDSVTPTNLLPTDERDSILPGISERQKDVCVLCVPDEESMELYLMCTRELDLWEEGVSVYLMCTEDIDLNRYTEAVWLNSQNQDEGNAISKGDIVLEIQDDDEDFSENGDENNLMENLTFDEDYYRKQSPSSHDKSVKVNLLPPFHLTSADLHQSLKVKTMSALSLKPVNAICELPPQEVVNLLPGNEISPLLGSPEVKDVDKSLSITSSNKIGLFTRQGKVKERSDTLRQQEEKGGSQMVTLREHVKEISQTARQQQVEEMSQMEIQQEERSQNLSQKVNVSPLVSRPQKEQETLLAVESQEKLQTATQKEGKKSLLALKVEQSSPHRIQGAKEICCNPSPTVTSFQTLEPADMTAKMTESDVVNKESSLVSGSKVVWTHQANGMEDDLVVEMQQTDLNNNEYTLCDSPELLPTEYEYTATDDYLCLEPLDLSIKPSKVSRSVTGNDSNANYLPSSWNNPCNNRNIEAEMELEVQESFSVDCIRKWNYNIGSKPTVDFNLNCPVSISSGEDNTRNVDLVGKSGYNPSSHFLKQGCNNVHISNDRDFCRSCPGKMKIDENANHIDANSNKSCLSDTAFCHPINVTGPCVAVQQDNGSTHQHTTHTEPRCADSSHDGSDRLESSFFQQRGSVCWPNSQSWSQAPPRNTRQQKKEAETLNPNLGNRIRDTFKSDEDKGWVNSKLSNYKVDSNISDRKPGWLTHSGNESNEMTRTPNVNPQKSQELYNASIDGHIEPDVHERMLMHMMYTPQPVRACQSSELYLQQREFSGPNDHPLDLVSVTRPRPTGVTVNQSDNNVPLDLVSVTRPRPTGVTVNQCDNNVPLDLSCNHTVWKESVQSQPSFETPVSYFQPNLEINNGLMNVRKIDPSFTMAPGILHNLRLPDNIPELLRQRAFPKRDYVSYRLHRGLSKGKTNRDKTHPTATGVAHPTATGVTHPTATGVSHPTATGVTHPTATGVTQPTATGVRVNTTYQSVPDVVPKVFTDNAVHTNNRPTSPRSVQLPDCVSDSIVHNNTHVRRGGISKNPSRTQNLKTKKDYTVLSQMLRSCDEVEGHEIPANDNFHLPSIRSGTSCTSFHVQPLVQAYPAMPHRHYRLGRLGALSYQQPHNAPVVPHCQQPLYFDNSVRKKQPGFSDQQVTVPTIEKELFRPYATPFDRPYMTSYDRSLERTYRTINTGFQNLYSNTTGLPGNVKFPERRVGKSDGMLCTDPWSTFQVNKAIYPQYGVERSIALHKTHEDGNSQPIAPENWRQFWFKDNEANILRYQHDLNQTRPGGNHITESEQDCNGNQASSIKLGMSDVEMSKTAKKSRISQTSRIAGLSDGRKETSGPGSLEVSGKGRKMSTKGRSKKGITEKPSLEHTNIVELVDRSLALAQGLTVGQSVNQLTDLKNLDFDSYCCRCWSRGKCRSCVCSKIGCHNCRNPICCFKETSPSQRKVRRQRKNSVKSKRTSEQHEGQVCSSELDAGIIGRTCGLTNSARQTSTATTSNNVASNSHTTQPTTAPKRTRKASNATPTSTAARSSYASQTNNTTQACVNADYGIVLVQPDTAQGEGIQTCLSRIVEQRSNTNDMPEPVAEKNLLKRSNSRHGSDRVEEMSIVQELRGKCEPVPQMEENRMVSSEQNLNMEQSQAFTMKRPGIPNESGLLTTVDKGTFSDHDKQDTEKIPGQEGQASAATIEHSEHKKEIAETFSDEKQSSCRIDPASGSVRTQNITTSEGISDSFKISTEYSDKSNKNDRGKKRKEKKDRQTKKMKVGSHQFQKEQNLDKNNNLGGNQRKNKKMAADTGKEEDQVPELMTIGKQRSLSDMLEQKTLTKLVDENNNSNTSKISSIGDGIDLNNNDVCCPSSAEILEESKQQTDLVKIEEQLMKSQNKSKRKRTKSKKDTDINNDSVVTLNEQCAAGNVTKTRSQGDIKQYGHTSSKKGRPRTKPLKQPKKVIPEVLINLEDHKDKYEVTQFTSFHKKDRNIEVGLKSFDRFTCRLCCGMYQYNTPDRTTMEEHLAQHLSGRLTCEDCGQTFSQAIHVQEHRQKTHRTANFTCELCAKQFFTSTTLKRHLCKAHGHKLFNCRQCPERFSSVHEVKMHVYQVHGGEATKCEKCGVISLSSKAAVAHAKSKMCIGREESNVPCPHCNRILSVSQMAHHVKRIHLRVHTYKCDQCPYTTLARTALNNHMMMHQGVHPFRCELCPFSCVKSYQLSSHMRTHTGDKPYRCDQCSYAAAWNVQLKDHMRAHTSPDSILCEECGILFKDDRCLNLHNKKIHKNNPEVKVTKRGKVKDQGTGQRRLSKTKAVKDTASSKMDSLNAVMESVK